MHDYVHERMFETVHVYTCTIIHCDAITPKLSRSSNQAGKMNVAHRSPTLSGGGGTLGETHALTHSHINIRCCVSGVVRVHVHVLFNI